METVYWVGSEIVSPDGEGNWVFGRETYTGSSLAENGDLTLGSGTRTVTVHSDDSGLSITERDGDETTITIQQEEGTTVEELEDDKLISRRHSGPVSVLLPGLLQEPERGGVRGSVHREPGPHRRIHLHGGPGRCHHRALPGGRGVHLPPGRLAQEVREVGARPGPPLYPGRGAVRVRQDREDVRPRMGRPEAQHGLPGQGGRLRHARLRPDRREQDLRLHGGRGDVQHLRRQPALQRRGPGRAGCDGKGEARRQRPEGRRPYDGAV